jgi:hypothetical protein
MIGEVNVAVAEAIAEFAGDATAVALGAVATAGVVGATGALEAHPAANATVTAAMTAPALTLSSRSATLPTERCGDEVSAPGFQL